MSRRRPTTCRRLAAVALGLALASPAPLAAQGCALCRDNALTTPPATQRAFRHAIELMTIAAAAFFTVTLVVVRRHR